MAAVAQLKAILGMDNSKYVAGAKGATGVTRQLASAITGAGAAMATGFSLNLLARGIRTITASASKLTDLATQASLTAEEFQTLQVAANDAGAPMELITKGIAGITIKMGQASRGLKTYIDLFEAAGITMDEVNNATPIQMLERLGAVINTTGDNSAAYKAVMELVGKRGIALKEVLQRLAKEGFAAMNDEMVKSGKILTNLQAAQLDEVEDSLVELDRRTKVFGGRLATVFLSGVDIVAGTFGAALLAATDKTVDLSEALDAVSGGNQSLAAAFDKANALTKYSGSLDPIDDKATKALETALAITNAIEAKRRDAAISRMNEAQQLLAFERELARLKATRAGLDPATQAKERWDITKQVADVEERILDLRQRQAQADKDRAEQTREGWANLELERRAREKEIADELDTKLTVPAGRGVRADSFAQMGGFVGGSRAGLGIADRQLKLMQAQAAREKRVAQMVESMNRHLDDIKGRIEQL